MANVNAKNIKRFVYNIDNALGKIAYGEEYAPTEKETRCIVNKKRFIQNLSKEVAEAIPEDKPIPPNENVTM